MPQGRVEDHLIKVLVSEGVSADDKDRFGLSEGAPEPVHEGHEWNSPRIVVLLFGWIDRGSGTRHSCAFADHFPAARPFRKCPVDRTVELPNSSEVRRDRRYRVSRLDQICSEAPIETANEAVEERYSEPLQAGFDQKVVVDGEDLHGLLVITARNPCRQSNERLRLSPSKVHSCHDRRTEPLVELQRTLAAETREGLGALEQRGDPAQSTEAVLQAPITKHLVGKVTVRGVKSLEDPFM